MNDWRKLLPWLQNEGHESQVTLDQDNEQRIDTWDTAGIIEAWYAGEWSGDPLHER